MQIDLFVVHTLLPHLNGQTSAAKAMNVNATTRVVNEKAVWVGSTHCF